MMADGFRLGAWLVALQSLSPVELPALVAAHVLAACVRDDGVLHPRLGATPHRRRLIGPCARRGAGFITALAALAATLHVWRQAIRRAAARCAGARPPSPASSPIDALTYAQAQWQGDEPISLSALRLGCVVIVARCR